ncbi:MAG: ferrochelatase [Elusimicrobiota bacterium]
MLTDKAILLLNLGGPENLSEVKPFLYRLFSDPEIIRIPFTPLRQLVAWAISTSRYKKSLSLYASVGGGSPIRKWTDLQAKLLEEKLQKEGKNILVRTAFNCSNPLVEDVIEQLSKEGIKTFFSLPLYPQYSLTTTKGSLERVRAAVKKINPQAKLVEMCCYPEEEKFIKAHSDLIRKELENFSGPNKNIPFLLFSAHSIPEKLVTKNGDPYKEQIGKSVNAIIKDLNWEGPFGISWQSKLGPVKWLEPSTISEIQRLGKEKCEQLLVIPIAFVTDHIETLHEIDIDFREEAEHVGIEEFRRTPGLNDHPLFIEALRDISIRQTDFW